MAPRRLSAGDTIAHYDEHLGDAYAWMCGGFEEATRAGRDEIAAFGIPARAGDLVVDLGCGFGKHTLPLLAAGARVRAIDTSHAMLELLRARLPSRASVRLQCGDIVDELSRSLLRPDAIACLGDTLTHLQGRGAVEHLLRACARVLAPDGRLALSFRDYSAWQPGEMRRFEVRAEHDRRADCVVIASRDHVTVEDTLGERTQGEWSTRSHRYRKLRIAPGAVDDMLRGLGLRTERLADHAGMTRILAYPG